MSHISLPSLCIEVYLQECAGSVSFKAKQQNMVAHTFNLSIWETETGGTHIQGYFGLYSKIALHIPPKDRTVVHDGAHFRSREHLFIITSSSAVV